MRSKRAAAVLVAAAVLSMSSCGGVQDVSGTWRGLYTLVVTGSESTVATQDIDISQRGGDISFDFAGCPMSATARSESSFGVVAFSCPQAVNQKTWTLESTSTGLITIEDGEFVMTLTGTATSGADSSRFTWGYRATR